MRFVLVFSRFPQIASSSRLRPSGPFGRELLVPKHTSWLNQVEIWFSVVVRRVLKRGKFTSLDALRQRLLDFIDYFNRTMAKPYRWTFTGQPLTK